MEKFENDINILKKQIKEAQDEKEDMHSRLRETTKKYIEQKVQLENIQTELITEYANNTALKLELMQNKVGFFLRKEFGTHAEEAITMLAEEIHNIILS